MFLFIGGLICYGSCLAAVGVGGFVGGIAVLPALGFTAGGIAAGSWASVWMAPFLGPVPAGNLLTILKSVGVAGLCSALCAGIDVTKPGYEESQ